MDQAGKNGEVKTFFTLLKGFIATAVFFLPRNFYNGGWLWSTICIIFSMLLTLICTQKLVEIKEQYNLSFTGVGVKAMGLTGKIMVDVTLCTSQFLFVCAYISFICESLKAMSTDLFGMQDGKWDYWYGGIICFFVFIPLVWV